MPMYASDNMESFAFSLFTEWYEEHTTDEDNKEERKEMREMIHAIPICRLKEWIGAQFEAIIGNPTGDLRVMFMETLMRSIDWHFLRTMLKEWEEGLKEDDNA